MIRAYFAGVVTDNKTSHNWQGWSRGSERIQGGNYDRPTGFWYDMDAKTQVKCIKANNGPKKNENEQAQICVTRCFTKQQKASRKRAKKTSREAAARQTKKQTAG